MKKIYLIMCATSLSLVAQAQTVLVDEDFESYASNQSVAQQSTLWETWSGSLGGSDDAIVSSDAALSGSNSLLIYHDNDMILPIGNYNSGHFIIEFNAYMIEEAYFNVMHTCKSSWAFDLYMTSSDEIVYLDEPNASANNVLIDSYTNNEWVNFRFDINIDLDSVTTYINNVKRHQSVFSNAVTGSTGSGLTCMNFYGLAGFNGVDHSNYHIDDILITQLNTSDVEELKVADVSIYPNPSNGNFEVKSTAVIKQISVVDYLGQEVVQFETESNLDISQLANGIYQVIVETESGVVRKELVVNH
ncbi:MAG: T9SS type A sorting domain-containing protein [Flavobacteriales bacterium]|nr:T9SS type A sorting domain-containing protein [Flavobacteriales bacterium]